MNAMAAMKMRINKDPGLGDLLGDLEAELRALLEDLLVATLTSRGLEAAEGRTRVPGVKRPSPRP